jgi:hypothetical protein
MLEIITGQQPYQETETYSVQVDPEGSIIEKKWGGTVLRLGLSISTKNPFDQSSFMVLFLGNPHPIEIICCRCDRNEDYCFENYKWLIEISNSRTLALTSPEDQLYLIRQSTTTGYGQNTKTQGRVFLRNSTLEDLQKLNTPYIHTMAD